MPKQLIETPRAPPARGAYSPALRAGDFIFVAGQSARDSQLNVVGTSIEDQTEKTLANVEAILKDAGASLADVVKATVHLSELGNFARYNKVYSKVVPEPWPTRTTVGSVLAPGVMIEIDVIAYVGR
jgi:2-iminobutanoate/2-iminopropanoate deaminase